MNTKELELTLRDLSRRVVTLENAIARSKNPDRWVSPAVAERELHGLFNRHAIKEKIVEAIETPSKSPLKSGVHYQKIGRRYMVNVSRWEEIDWSQNQYE